MKVIGLAGWSGAGKTTLLSRLIPHFLESGLRVSVIKHAHHSFDVDVPGKDSWVHRQSGATAVLVARPMESHCCFRTIPRYRALQLTRRSRRCCRSPISMTFRQSPL